MGSNANQKDVLTKDIPYQVSTGSASSPDEIVNLMTLEIVQRLVFVGQSLFYWRRLVRSEFKRYISCVRFVIP